MRYILIAIFMVGLVYMLTPGSSSIDQFAPIPNSLKSDEPGDTVQAPNIAAYFSDFDRKSITNFYRNEYRKQFWFGKFIPPISLNHPPRAAYTYVRDLQMSTFLEEYVYPLHGSLFVNGYEPTVEAHILNLKPSAGDIIHIKDQYFKSKATIRFYPNEWWISLLVYVSIWIAAVSLFRLFREAYAK